jgi:transposase
MAWLASDWLKPEQSQGTIEPAFARMGHGRPLFDPVMMFKILVIQTINNLSDERTEFLINDCLSFMRFLGLEAYNARSKICSYIEKVFA